MIFFPKKNVCGLDGFLSHHHPCLHGSRDTYVTGVNTLLLQQVQAVSPAQPVDVINWLERIQYVEDNYAVSVETGTATLVSRNREEELQEVGREMNQPLINGNRVLMTILEVSLTYGIEGEVVKIVGFFDDGSNCSVIKNSLATKL